MAKTNASRQPTADLHVEPRQCPEHAVQAEQRQGSCQRCGLIERRAASVGIAQIHALRRFGKTAQDEVARQIDRLLATGLAERVVVEAVEHVFFLDRRTEPIEESVLRAVMHHPVGAGNQQLRRHGNRLRIGDHAFGSIVKRQQDIDRNGAGNQRVGVIRYLPRRVVRQELRLDVTVNKKIAA